MPHGVMKSGEWLQKSGLTYRNTKFELQLSCINFFVIFAVVLTVAHRISMNRMGKNSRLIFVLLAGLVILLHATIPHHHHLDSDHSSSPTTETRGESVPEADKHCHALNNIVLTKANSITIDTNTAFNALLFVITAFNLIKLYDSVLLATFPIKDIVILKQHLSSELSFRGPPTLV